MELRLGLLSLSDFQSILTFCEVLAFEERMRTSATLAGSFVHTFAVPDCGSMRAEASRRCSCFLPHPAESRITTIKYIDKKLHDSTNSNFPKLTASITVGPGVQAVADTQPVAPQGRPYVGRESQMICRCLC